MSNSWYQAGRSDKGKNPGEKQNSVRQGNFHVKGKSPKNKKLVILSIS